MEPTGIKTKIAVRITIYFALALVVYGALAGFYTNAAIAITKRQDAPVNILILTAQPIFISYNPKYKKAIVTNLEPTHKGTTAEEVLQASNIDGGNILFIDPQTKQSAKFWKIFKNNLYSWQHKPYLIFSYVYNYIKLRINKKTNIKAGAFIMLTMDLQGMLPSDFSVKNNLPQQVRLKGARKIKEQQPPEPQLMLAQNIELTDTKPILIEIINASGKNGLAAEATRYLRRLNNDGTLNLDIINYTTAPQTEPKTHIIDLSSRLADLQNIGKYIGLSDSEIVRQTNRTVIVEAKIVLGQDFKIATFDKKDVP